MARVLGYGEDALTLWAILHKLDAILHYLGDLSVPSICQVFYRSSFGRSGGENSSQFGEFDFIILAQACLYLGESKWDRSSEKVKGGVLQVHPGQQLRHQIFRFYVEQWLAGDHAGWGAFLPGAMEEAERRGIAKPLAPEGSLLAENLQAVLRLIKSWYPTVPRMRNVLLYLHNGKSEEQLPEGAAGGFELVPLDYSEAAFGNLVRVWG